MWAVHHRVDVISLSWGLPKSSEIIESALAEAHNHNVVIVAAAANYASRHDIAFPAKLKDYVICIGSADGNGNISPFSAESRELEKYAAPGEAVRGASIANILPRSSFAALVRSIFKKNDTERRDTERRDTEHRDTERRDGTSVATPIAAGIAALFIEYTRHSSGAFKDGGNHENMLKLFSAMSERKQNQTYRFLDPSRLFSSPGPERKIEDILHAGILYSHLQELTIF